MAFFENWLLNELHNSYYHKIIFFIIFLTYGSLWLFEFFCSVFKKLFAFKVILLRCNHLTVFHIKYIKETSLEFSLVYQ
jgi:hypothetical protein